MCVCVCVFELQLNIKQLNLLPANETIAGTKRRWNRAGAKGARRRRKHIFICRVCV